MKRRLARLINPGMGFYYTVLVCFCLAAFLMGQTILAVAELAVTILTIALFALRRSLRRKDLARYLRSCPTTVESVGEGRNPFPALMIRLEDGHIIWHNAEFDAICPLSDSLKERTLDEAVPGLSTDWLSAGKTESPYDVTIEDRRYRVNGTMLWANDTDGSPLGVLYFSDLTLLYQVRDEYVRSRPVVSIILVDNYEELTKNLTESAISALNAQLGDAITEWTDGYHGLLRKLERNRFLFIFEKRDLTRATEDKFSLLESIHQVKSPSGLPASVSIGLGVDGSNFEESYNFAALSIEMSLSRGGDQAVIKDRINFTFYGGKSAETDYSSKVRSRVTANSLMELIGQSSQVFIMGHRNADMDSIGAAMGISCMCRKKGKKAFIVLDTEQNAAPRLVAQILQDPEYKDAFISGQDALLQCDSRSILVVVDTNRPDQVECKPLLESISKVCVVDHHRRAADYINPVVVNFHEPSASSASELATELLEYSVDSTDVLQVEAEALLAGIFLDTKSFHVRTGERTFDAAATLRRMGADTVRVKVLLQNDFQDTMAKYQILKAARMYRSELAIAALSTPANRILAAQAADELLNISGITASFVLYPDGDTVIVSARSIGSANVQVILEPLGGGGNAATAGAQIRETTVKAVLDQLVASIDAFYNE